jgi:hypothetical protein
MPGIFDVILESGPLDRMVVSGLWCKTGRDLHAHDALHLLSPIADTKFALFKCFGHFLLAIRVSASHIRHVLHQSLYITHSQELVNERLR